jgi:hypothetical protein
MVPSEVQQVKQLLIPLLQDGWSLEFNYGSSVTYTSAGTVSHDYPTRVMAKVSRSADGTNYGPIALVAQHEDTILSEADIIDWAKRFIAQARA